MSYNFINKFQQRLYELISSLDLVKQHIKKILFTSRQDELFPVIFVQVNNVSDLSKYDYELFEVDFDISIYWKNKNTELALSIASAIKNTLIPENCSFDKYITAGISCNNLSTEQAKDLVSSKLKLEYKTLISLGGLL